MAIDYYAAKAIRYDDDILICAGDVETDGLGGDLLMVQWGYFGEVYYSTGPNMVNDFFNVFLNMPRPAVWFFHFGQYDWRYFLEYIEENNLLVQIGLRTDTDIYEIRVRRNDKDAWSIMRDSYALWSQPLDNLADSFCPEIPKLDIDIEHFNPSDPEHIEYAKRDVQILLTGLPRLFDMVSQHFRVNPSATVAGTALKAWQRSLPHDKIYDASRYGEVELFIRQGYYGGIVFLTNNRTNENCETYDINSSYPYNMVTHGVPCGAAHYTTDFEDEYHGIYRVLVRAPDDLIIPILPARNERGSMRWYSGQFETVVTTRELQFAVKHGYEVLDLYEGYFFERIEYPFTDFITQCKLIREVHKGEAEEAVAKLLQNSLYGKFGSRRDRTRLVHHSDLKDDVCGLTPFDPAGFWYSTTELDEEMLCLPQWAAFITANARLKLLEAAYTIGPENVIYGDTDSLTIKAGHADKLDIGQDYGQFKLETQWKVFRAIAPKVYSGLTVDNEFKGAAKGMPKKSMDDSKWRELLERGETSASTMSLASLKIAMKQGIRPATELTRRSSTLNNSMNFTALQNGNIKIKSAHG